MSAIAPDVLAEIIARHGQWLRGEEGGARADLSDANLSRANLSRANMSDANMSDANMSRADLSDANMSDANLSRANLGHRSIVPESGAFTGWKKLQGGVIAQLHISAKAERVSSYVGRKCRASKVCVVAMFGRDGSPVTGPVGGLHDAYFVYTTGAVVVPDSFDPDQRVECSHGIHFFITRKEAEEYQ